MQVVILSGGAGSRLWPVSSPTKPKPFIKMQDGQTLMRKALLRACGVSSIAGVISVTSRNFIELLQEERKNIEPLNNQCIESHFILEPFAKNTAAAIASAALYVRGIFGPDEIMLILPADHVISDEAAFQVSVSKAEIIAAEGKIVTLGIKPTYPEIGYGYIEMEQDNVKQFIEKPSLKIAKEYAQSRNFFWNSGIFCFTAQTIIDEMEKYSPQVLHSVKECMDQWH